MRGASALHGSCVIAAATLLGRGVTAAWEGGAWEGHHCCMAGASGASPLHGTMMVWEGCHCVVRGASAQRWSSVIAAAMLHGRCVTAGWEGRGKGITAA